MHIYKITLGIVFFDLLHLYCLRVSVFLSFYFQSVSTYIFDSFCFVKVIVLFLAWILVTDISSLLIVNCEHHKLSFFMSTNFLFLNSTLTFRSQCLLFYCLHPFVLSLSVPLFVGFLNNFLKDVSFIHYGVRFCFVSQSKNVFLIDELDPFTFIVVTNIFDLGSVILFILHLLCILCCIDHGFTLWDIFVFEHTWNL